jgi:hypothetical protein
MKSLTPRLAKPLALASITLLAGCGPVSALLHDPRGLPCIDADCRIRYEPGAEAYAEAIGDILPRAKKRIESRQGRPFGRPFVVVAFADDADYAAANGRASTLPHGVAFMDRITLSPRLWRDDRGELEPYLTHELSHAHLLSHMSSLALIHIPAWFTEGLAVWASDGGGATRVSPAEAARAIAEGLTIETPDETGALGQMSLPFVKDFRDDNPYRRAHMAYRQAGMFVGWLHDRDQKAFAALLDRVVNGESFRSAFAASFGVSVALAWREFASQTKPD